MECVIEKLSAFKACHTFSVVNSEIIVSGFEKAPCFVRSCVLKASEQSLSVTIFHFDFHFFGIKIARCSFSGNWNRPHFCHFGLGRRRHHHLRPLWSFSQSGNFLSRAVVYREDDLPSKMEFASRRGRCGVSVDLKPWTLNKVSKKISHPMKLPWKLNEFLFE